MLLRMKWLKSLNNGAPGPDEVYAMSLKMVSSFIIEPLIYVTYPLHRECFLMN